MWWWSKKPGSLLVVGWEKEEGLAQECPAAGGDGGDWSRRRRTEARQRRWIGETLHTCCGRRQTNASPSQTASCTSSWPYISKPFLPHLSISNTNNPSFKSMFSHDNTNKNSNFTAKILKSFEYFPTRLFFSNLITVKKANSRASKSTRNKKPQTGKRERILICTSL